MQESHETYTGASEQQLAYIRAFRLMDDDYMAKFFEDNKECTEFVLKIIMDNPGLRVESVHSQHEIRNLQGHSVRLDVYAIDTEGKKYDIEIQRSEKGASPKRARYNSSAVDVNILPQGAEYDRLTENYVIFITERDELGADLPIYHIDRTIRETGEPFGDGSHIIYVNGAYRDNTPLGILMHDFMCSDPEKMKYKVLADRARYLKGSKEGIQSMCRAMEEMTRNANREARITAARKMIKRGKLSYEEISEYMDLTLEEVESLAEEMLAASAV